MDCGFCSGITISSLTNVLMQGYKVIFYGDDVFENFLAHNSGMGWAGTPSVRDQGSGATAFAEHFAKKYKTGVYAISGTFFSFLPLIF